MCDDGEEPDEMDPRRITSNGPVHTNVLSVCGVEVDHASAERTSDTRLSTVSGKRKHYKIKSGLMPRCFGSKWKAEEPTNASCKTTSLFEQWADEGDEPGE